ncbi:MAG TPA: FecR family protein, partial [Xanthobacteraceae bacterium]|nr:FecR family protein [Xanthobacteraceae bacterium]
MLVPDTELLFTAQFHRAGPDLVLTGRDGAHHLVPGYFSSEHHPALVAPNGAHLSPDTVDLLAGSPTPGHYAQAQPTAPPDAIGKIEKVVGDVSVVRNGVTVALHVGDAVFKSDVVQTGASSACGISFPDGTALNLVANTRMALNDYAYDANSNSNGALFSLVEGTFAFVAGKVAHSGDMKIATPVATMGIRGTTGVVQEQPNPPATITANAGDHTYSFAVVPDIGTGITGMWDVYLTDAYGIIQRDANGNPIVLVTVSQSGYVTYVTPQGVGQAPLVTTEPVTNSQYAFEQQMLADLFRTLNPSNLNNNNNGGSSTQPPPFNLPNPIPQLFEDTGKPFTINFTNGSTTPTPPIIDIVI